MSRALVLLALVLAACEARLSLGSPCTRSSDCPTPYACLLGSCRAECVSDADCAIGVRCVAVGGGAGACTFDAEEHCTSTVCPSPLSCTDDRCTASCATDGDCLAGQSCSGGSCRSAPPVDGGTGDAGSPLFPDPVLCTTAAANCEEGEICDSDSAPDVCRTGCGSNADCPAGSACDYYAADVDGGYVFGCSTVCRPGTGEGCAPGLTCWMVVRSQRFVAGEPNNITVCAGEVPGRTQGCPCEQLDFAYDCAAGFSCEMPTAGRMCLQICRVGTECPDGQLCVATPRSVVLGGVQYGVCPPPAVLPTDCP